jgi:hypothetical protein
VAVNEVQRNERQRRAAVVIQARGNQVQHTKGGCRSATAVRAQKKEFATGANQGRTGCGVVVVYKGQVVAYPPEK